jgi:NADH-quinone oxidoreductase subunit N
MAVMASIPMLSPLNEKLYSGILRYLSLQTLAMPFILLAGWLLTGVESVPPDSPLIMQSMMLLGIGFMIWLSVFPFHSWVPMVTEKSRPIVFSYLLFIMPTTILVFSLNFFERYSFLRASEALYEILRLIGVLMVVFGGVLTAYQTNLKRAFGFAVLTETGFSILCLGLADQGGLTWMLVRFPARALGFLLWGYILAWMENYTGHLDRKNLAGLAHQYPILSAGLLLAQLSIAGLPLLASFPVKGNLMVAVIAAGQGLGTWTFIGSLGLFIFSLRLLSALVTSFEGDLEQSWRVSEKAREYIPIILMVFGLLWMGLFPGKLLSGIAQTLIAFSQLQ